MKKPLSFISIANRVFSVILLLAITLSFLGYVFAATPNPGHPFSAIGGGIVQGDLLYGSSTDVFAALEKNSSSTRYLSNTGINNNPAWAQINLVNGVVGILPSANGGTNNGFIAFTGPVSSLRTFTLPNATSTILTDFTQVTVAQGGTGLGNLTLNNVVLGNGTNTVQFVPPGNSGNLLQSDGTTWTSASGGLLIGRQTLTAGTTYTPTTGTTEILVRLWAGGGAGGGCSAVAGCAGGGGGSGGYAEYYFSGVTGTYTYAIGAGGTGVSGAAGGNGGNTSITINGVTITALGGTGGTFTAGTAAIKFMAGGAGGAISTNGQVNAAGAPGGPGMTGTSVLVNMSGLGGSTSLGGGGVGRTSATGIAGSAALTNTGSGGSGAAAGTNTANAGGAGAAGMIIITEFR